MKTPILLFLLSFPLITGCQIRELKESSDDEFTNPYSIQPNPSADDLSVLPLHDRSAVMYGNRNGFAKLVYTEQNQKGALLVEPQIIRMRTIAAGKQVLMNPQSNSRWPSPSLDALSRARARSGFHEPLELEITGKSFWLITDLVCQPEKDHESGGSRRITRFCSVQTEIYDQRPGPGIIPKRVVAWGSREYDIPENKLLTENIMQRNRMILVDSTAYEIGEPKFRENGALSRVLFRKWKPDVYAILDGDEPVDEAVSGQTRVSLENAVNDALIEWKVQEMNGYFRRTQIARLREIAVQIEKSLFKLDTRSRLLKDSVDRDAQQMTREAPEKAQETAHLLDQRKTIIIAILGTLKQAIRSKEGE